MPRLFTGIALPADHVTALSLLQNGLPEARWIEPSDLHITLRFIGDVEPHLADEIADALARQDYQAPTIRLTGLDVFGGDKPRSLFARVEETEPLMRLQKSQEALMQRFGLPAEKRRYTPHVTLARGRNWSGHDVRHWLASHMLPSLGGFRPKEFNLYSVRDSVGGGPYIVEERYPFSKS